jgi:TolA-binding protein
MGFVKIGVKFVSIRVLYFLIAVVVFPDTSALFAQQAPTTNPSSEEARMEYKANDLLNRGVELLESKQEERGLKMISSVPQMFPKSKARFKAWLALGKHYVKTRQFDLAVKQFEHLNDSEDVDQQAEGLYQTGICFYGLTSYDKAFMSFRRVTNEFPWSVYANEAYYYIGQCHFKLGRWAKAVEALEMVGTSVDPDAKESPLAEAGQRLYVKVYDKDLAVLKSTGGKYTIALATKSGDKEQITIEPLGRSGEYYIGSLPTTPGDAKPNDGTLQTVGPDVVTVDYLDQNTEAGKRDQPRKSEIRIVSTAVAGFTDGAYREYTKGVFADQDAFLRVKDLDRDTTPRPDSVTVRVFSEYKHEPDEKPAQQTGVTLEQQPEIVQRDSATVTLTETGPHTGIFTAALVPKIVADAAQVGPGDSILSVMKGDDVGVEYQDQQHIAGGDAVLVKSKAKLLIGQIQDVKVEHRVVDSLDLKARKHLIEAKIYLRLGQIFKEVGLTNKASEKAADGLDRVEDVISTSLRASLDRNTVEEAFSVKWDLLLVQDKLGEAIEVCRRLTELFPDSTLVDRALLKIGQAKAEGEDPAEAIGIFASVTQLPKSALKAEAQFYIGDTLEKIATRQAEASGQPPSLSAAMNAYKTCAEQYPNSPFAGDSLDRIANYYINAKDYARAIELMERVTQDYPDAGFLDKMLLKWVIASYRMGDPATAKAKAEQLLSEYPNSKSAEKARQFLETINKKIGATADAPASAKQ